MHNYSYSVVWSDEDNCYIATSPEFPRLSAFGETDGEALGELAIVLKAAIETYKEEGWELPQPQKVQEYSGQFRVRVPKKLHGQLAQQAESEGVSLNTLIVSYLSAGLGEAKSQLRHPQNIFVAYYGNNARISGGPAIAQWFSIGTQGYARPQVELTTKNVVYYAGD